MGRSKNRRIRARANKQIWEGGLKKLFDLLVRQEEDHKKFDDAIREQMFKMLRVIKEQKDNKERLEQLTRRSFIRGVAAGGITALFIAAGERLFNDTLSSHNISFAIAPPKGITESTYEGHYIYAGNGLSTWGVLLNEFAKQLEDKLEYDGKGYGYHKSSGSYQNMLILSEAERNDTPRSFGFVQEDLFNGIDAILGTNLRDNLSVVLETDVFEGVFLLSGSDRYPDLATLAVEADKAARGERPKITIACPNKNKSGPYYTAQFLANAINPDGFELIDVNSLENVIDYAKAGQYKGQSIDLGIMVQYPGRSQREFHGGLKSLIEKGSGLGVVRFDTNSFYRFFDNNQLGYRLADVNIPNMPYQPFRIPIVRTLVIGPNPNNFKSSATTADVRALHEDIQWRFQSSPLTFDEQPVVSVIEKPNTAPQTAQPSLP